MVIAKKLSFCCTITLTSICAYSQSLDIEYATECQYGISANKLNWVNLLTTDIEIPLYKNGSVSISTLHIYNSKEEKVTRDLLTFSNIYEHTNYCALATFGYNQKIGNSTLFVGVRNINQDYFTSEVTSFFTNSSCGVFPTISMNYPIANYPASSIGIHYELLKKHYGVKASIYNGVGYDGWKKENNPFILNIGRDGILGMVELNYKSKYGNYYSGISLHSGMLGSDENSISTETSETKKSQKKEFEATMRVNGSCSWWLYGEPIFWDTDCNNISGIMQISMNSMRTNCCQSYCGAGFKCAHKSRCGKLHQFGMIASWTTFANMDTSDEKTLEMSYCYQFRNMKIQPSIHIISNEIDNLQVALLARVSYALNIQKRK